MLLLGHAAVSARRGPRGTCQETRAALWAPAECGVTARSASDGVDVNGIRVHHRRLQYRRYQCGMRRKENKRRPLRCPVFGGLLAGEIKARFARLERASCCGVHSEGNPSDPFVLGLLGLKLKGIRRASRIAWSAARASCVLRSVPKSKLMAGPAMSGLRRISRWLRVVLGATCKKRSFQQPKIDA